MRVGPQWPWATSKAGSRSLGPEWRLPEKDREREPHGRRTIDKGLQHTVDGSEIIRADRPWTRGGDAETRKAATGQVPVVDGAGESVKESRITPNHWVSWELQTTHRVVGCLLASRGNCYPAHAMQLQKPGQAARYLWAVPSSWVGCAGLRLPRD
ncbi:hypothetical protein VTN96DRAFT_124 [Rasamsonia emersonii]